jgi:predicted alpha/beta superfamily hydrolase
MPKGIMFVPSQPATPAREDEYHQWYSKTHIPEVCEVDGVVAARRYKIADPAQADAGASTYIALYELDADDFTKVFEEIANRAMDGRIQMSDVLSMDPPPVPVIYELLD